MSLDTSTIGLFHLEPIPPFIKKSNRFVQLLFRTIRDASDRDGGRDIPTEDFYRTVLSFWEVRDDAYIVRLSNIGPSGRAHGNTSMIDTLREILLIKLKAAKYTVMTEGDRYDHFCNPDVFSKCDQDYLYAPDHRNIKTYVVLTPRLGG